MRLTLSLRIGASAALRALRAGGALAGAIATSSCVPDPDAPEDPAAELAAGWDAAGASSTCMLCDDEPAASRDAGCISASIDACSPALNVAKGETSVWCCQKCWGGCNMTGPCPLRVAVSGSSSAGESVVRRFVDCSSCKSAWTAQIDHFSTNSSNRISL